MPFDAYAFLQTLPAAKAPPERLRSIGILPPVGAGIDSLHHVVAQTEDTTQYWLLLEGGVAGLNQWYGPLDAHDERARTLLAHLVRLR